MSRSTVLGWIGVSGLLGALAISGCGTTPFGEGEGGGGGRGDSPSDTILASNAKLVSDDGSLWLVSSDGQTMRFRGSGASVGIAEGDILLGVEDGGYVRRVEAVREDADGLLLADTSPAVLTDAVEELHLRSSTKINPEPASVAKASNRLARVGASGNLDLSGIALIDRPGLQVEISSGDVFLSGGVDWAIDISWFQLEYFETVADGRLDLDIDVHVEADVAGEYGKETEVFRQAKPFLVGVVAGRVIVTIYAGVEAQVTGVGTLDTGLDTSTSFEAGAYWSDGAWHPIRDRSTDFNMHDWTWNMEGTVGARAYVRPEIEVEFYGTVGPALDLEPYVGFEGWVQMPSCLYEWELSVGIASHAHFRAGILDWDLAEYETTLFDWNRTIARDDGDLCPSLYLTASTVGDGDIWLNPSGGVYDQGTVVSMTASPSSGWRFDHWEGDVSGTSPTKSVTMTRDRAVVGVFEEEEIEPETYRLTTTTIGSGTVFPSSGWYDEGTIVDLIATPDIGWHFDHWEGDASGFGPTTTVTMNGDRTVEAVFEENSVSDEVFVSADFHDPSIVTENCSIVTHYTYYNTTYGDSWRMLYPGTSYLIVNFTLERIPDSLTLTVTHLSSGSSGCPGGGYSPVDFKVNGSLFLDNYDVAENHGGTHGMATDQWDISDWVNIGANDIRIEFEDDPWACTHYWIQSLTIDDLDADVHYLNVSTTGAGSVAPPSGWYDEGTVVDLVATPDTGWRFDHWEGDASGSRPTTTVTMNGDRTVEAVFEEDSASDEVFVSADFHDPSIVTENCSVVTHHTYYNTAYGDSWRMLYPGSSYLVVNFTLERIPGSLTLTVTHLSSGSSGCPGGGYSPVDFKVNGSLFLDNYDVAENHGGTHGMATDQWDISDWVNIGANDIRIEFEDDPWACTHYWIQDLEIGE